jgi:protein-disulfide isomerase
VYRRRHHSWRRLSFLATRSMVPGIRPDSLGVGLDLRYEAVSTPVCLLPGRILMNHRRLFALLFLLTVFSLIQGCARSALAQPDQEIPADYYPGLDFGILDASERQIFVQVAQQQTCPCFGIEDPLAQCLTDADNRCGLAELAASLIMRRIKEDADSATISAEVGTYLQQQLTPRTFNLTNAPRRGGENATVQIVVFSDFECPFCMRFAQTLQQAEEEFGDRIAVYYKHLPIDGHPHALILAHAAIAAGNQGQFWPMHDLIFASQDALYQAPDISAAILDLATQLGLDTQRFSQDMANPDLETIALQDREEGRAAGVRATPTCFINGIEFRETNDYDHLRTYINRLLAQ